MSAEEPYGSQCFCYSTLPSRKKSPCFNLGLWIQVCLASSFVIHHRSLVVRQHFLANKMLSSAVSNCRKSVHPTDRLLLHLPEIFLNRERMYI